jgi:farnesyl diphosphate synthase
MSDTHSQALSARAAQVEAFLDEVLGNGACRRDRAAGAADGGHPPWRAQWRQAFSAFPCDGNGETVRRFDEAQALPVAAALECVHCYSLIHDDLPAMDDDDVRRGQPTVHKAFDEATAILAGDSLLTFAFDLVTDPANGLSGEIRADLASRLARAAGFGGMAGGQALDLAAPVSKPGEDGIVTLQGMKTGALIRFACEAGAVIGGAEKADIARMRSFGEIIGRAFQLADDLLDVTQTADAMGKATGKDAEAGKATLVSLRGADWAREELSRLVGEAEKLLAPFGAVGETLAAAAHFVAERQS